MPLPNPSSWENGNVIMTQCNIFSGERSFPVAEGS
jgi:hypothetical protein